ncbi:MAG: Mrp/NBP35 family ATP-binding protein [Candidatus Nanopelagicales bacterium]|jgi:ATP-binding protein involved in chromosome partitioning|nr:Mrp/NBP35 family ATP-binding protein [Candidatus Nanopelagicales bacterium]MCU0295255.1 Mrp/NBP35 family ATP-binding protein [Candidatus Nanopelagicales bacterium]
MPTTDAISAALATVEDPEIRRPITDLGMVKSVELDDHGMARVEVYLTIAACPMQSTLRDRIEGAVAAVPGVTGVELTFDVMSEEQRKALREMLQGPQKENPFDRPGNLTKIIAVASGKGGVGKSSVTSNLAVQLAAMGQKVGLIDADIYGHSIPRLLGVTHPPTIVEGMLMPPQAYGVTTISVLPFKSGGNSQAVAFRGPMLHRALNQFLTDVYWGDLDWLLLDLPPGTGDVAISVAQLLPRAEILVVTTPQVAAAEVAVRAGMLSEYTNQRVMGVVENMSAFPCPHCGEPMDLFGAGGGEIVSKQLSASLKADVPLLGKIPFDVRLREGGDQGRPLVLDVPDAPASAAIKAIAQRLAAKPRGLAGMNLGIAPVGR